MAETACCCCIFVQLNKIMPSERTWHSRCASKIHVPSDVTGRCRQQHSALISPDCAHALAREALAWLEPGSLQGFAHILIDEDLASIRGSSGATVPELATAVVAAVLRYLATYCRQVGHQNPFLCVKLHTFISLHPQHFALLGGRFGLDGLKRKLDF